MNHHMLQHFFWTRTKKKKRIMRETKYVEKLSIEMSHGLGVSES